MKLTRYKLGDLIMQSDERNKDAFYSLKDVKGMSVQKVFIETKADMENVSLKPYKLVRKNYFSYVTVTSRNSDKITLALNKSDDTYIVSSSYIVFYIKRPELLSSEYLFMYFNRPEFDRYTRFNSWGSARETFDWDEMCSIDIDLPPLPIQEKYVAIYNGLLKNQQSYERGLEDLKNTVFSAIDVIKNSASRILVSRILEEIDRRNENEEIKDIKGLNINKEFILSSSNDSDVNIKKYKIVSQNQFAFSGMQTGRDKCIRISLHDREEPIIISPAYSVFYVNNPKCIAEYLMIWFSRIETDRLGWFVSDSSIRANLDLDRFREMKIPIPDITIQKSIANIYKVYKKRKEINEKLKKQIKDICPILIKGSIEEAKALSEG